MKRPKRFVMEHARERLEAARAWLRAHELHECHEVLGPAVGTLSEALDELERREAELAAIRAEVASLGAIIEDLRAELVEAYTGSREDD